LAQRSRIRRHWQWTRIADCPLAWGLPQSSCDALTGWLQRLNGVWSAKRSSDKKSRKLQGEIENWLTSWLDGLGQRLAVPADSEASAAGEPCGLGPEDPLLGIQAVSAAWLLPFWAPSSPPPLGERCLTLLTSLAQSGGRESAVTADALQASSLQIELPLTLSWLLPLVPLPPPTVALRKFKDQLEEVTDGNGQPSSVHLAQLPGLLASWTRIWQLESAIDHGLDLSETRDRYSQAFQQYLRLLRADGTPMLGAPTARAIEPGLVAAWLKIAGKKRDRSLAGLACPQSLSSHLGLDLAKTNKLPPASDYSDWGKVAVLRSRWRRKGDKLAIDFGQRQVRMELNHRRSWLQGPLETQILWRGQPLVLEDQWTEVCWECDEDVAYLEIQNDLEEGCGLVQRQFLLAPRDRFCFIADGVFLDPSMASEDTASLEHQWQLPLASGVEFRSTEESREGWLCDGQHQLSVLPLTLPEWKVEAARGAWHGDSSGLTTHYNLPAMALYQAVLIDLDRQRSQRPLSWRQLAVGQQLRPTRLDQALGFRVQLHRQQYLFYRSLTESCSRSVLGQNLHCDFYAGRFLPDGNCQPIVTIEAADAQP